MAFKSLENIEEPKSSFSSLEEKIGGTATLKDAWQTPSIKTMVEDLGFKPYQAAAMRTVQQVGTPLWKFANRLSGGVIAEDLRQSGKKIPDTEIEIAGRDISRGVDTAANIGGFVAGVPMMLGKGFSKAVPKAAVSAPLQTKIGLGALSGAAQFGVASALDTPEEQFDNWRGRLGRGALGAGLGAVAGGVSGAVEHFTKLLSDSSILETGKQVRGGFAAFKKSMSTRFESLKNQISLKNPTKRVDISSQVKALPKLMEDSRKFKTLANVSPRLRKVAESKNYNLTLDQTQSLVNQLKETVSEGKLAGKSVRPSDREIMDFIGSIQKAKHQAFPDMVKVDRAYGSLSEQANAIENIMKFGKTETSFKKTMENPAFKKALKTALPKDIFDKVMETAKAQNLSKEMWRGVDYLIRFGIIYGLINKISGKVIDSGGDEETLTGG